MICGEAIDDVLTYTAIFLAALILYPLLGAMLSPWLRDREES